MPSTWRADLPSYSRQKIYLSKNGGKICPGAEKKDSNTEDKKAKEERGWGGGWEIKHNT
jgi:hypothetical protein